MAAHSFVIDDINKLADEMIQAGHNRTDYVKKRRAEINDKSVPFSECHYF